MRALAARGYAQAVLPPHERPHVPSLRALGLRRQRRPTCIAQAARDASPAARRVLVGVGDVDRQRGNGQPVRRHRRWPRALDAGQSGRAFPPRARGADHHARAARDLRRHRALLPCTTRCRPRRNSATKVRPITRASPPPRPRPASSSSSTGGARSANGRATVALPGAADARSAAGDRAPASASIRARTRFRAAESRGDRRGVFPQRRDRRRRRQRAVLPRTTRSSTSRRVLAAPARAACPGSRRSSSATPTSASNDAVATYLFNSQLLTRADGRMLLVAPAECRENRRIAAYLDRLLAAPGPIAEVLTFDLRQSMRNGGGPACLRLRVALTDAERAAIRRTCSSTTRWMRRSSAGSRDTIATGCCRPISPTRRCSTNRGARSTN